MSDALTVARETARKWGGWRAATLTHEGERTYGFYNPHGGVFVVVHVKYETWLNAYGELCDGDEVSWAAEFVEADDPSLHVRHLEAPPWERGRTCTRIYN